MSVRLEPCVARIIGDRKNSIVGLLSVMCDRPGHRTTDKNDCESCNLGGTAAQDKSDDQPKYSHRQSIDRERINENVNVFWLTKVLAKRSNHGWLLLIGNFPWFADRRLFLPVISYEVPPLCRRAVKAAV